MPRCQVSLFRTLLGVALLCSCLWSAAHADGDRLDFFTEGFESGWLPDGWTTIHEGSAFQWGRTSQFQHSGNYSAWVRGSSNPQDEWLVTPALNFSTLAEPQLEWYEQTLNWDAGDHHAIMVSTTSPSDPAAFSPLFEMDSSNHTPPGFGGPPTTIDLSSLAGEPLVYLAFRYYHTEGTGDHWWIDDIRIFELLERDIMAVSVSPDGENFEDGASVEPVATFYNNGVDTESFTADLQIYETGTLIYAESQQVTDLASDTFVDVTFPAFTVAAGNVYDMQAVATMDGDLNPNNDTASGYATTWTNDHVPMCILFTNSGCVPCVPANQVLDAYMPSQGNEVALTRVHVWWPFGGDIMYLANTAQAQSLVDMYGVSGVPNFFVDGFIDLGSSSGTYVPNIDARKLLKRPMYFDLAWNTETDELTIQLVVDQPLLPSQDGAEVKLRAVISEDDIEHNGGNGEPIHMQAFRRMWPTTEGMDITLAGGTQEWIFECRLQDFWVYENLKAAVYIQHGDTGEILQAATAFLSEIEAPTPVEDELVRVARLDGNFPNPFNPSTTIKYSLPGERLVELAVYAVDGTRVATLVYEVRTAGTHEVTWNGLDDSGQRVASGTYFYRIDAGDFSQTRSMTLVK